MLRRRRQHSAWRSCRDAGARSCSDKEALDFGPSRWDCCRWECTVSRTSLPVFEAVAEIGIPPTATTVGGQLPYPSRILIVLSSLRSLPIFDPRLPYIYLTHMH